MPSLPAFVIGVFSPAETAEAMPALNRLAMAGGTGTPSLVSANADLSKSFQDALDKIRGTVLPGEFKIPPPTTGTLDFGKVNVRLRSAPPMTRSPTWAAPIAAIPCAAAGTTIAIQPPASPRPCCSAPPAAPR
jgi:hypothetical protein